MNLTDKTLPELKEELLQKDFQWIKGDKIGNIEGFKNVILDESTGMTFVEFLSGGRINLELLNEYMDIFTASKIDYSDVNPSVAQSDIPIVSQIPQSKNQKVNQAISSIELEESPIYTLLKKQKENWVNVNITLKLNLPSKSLYNVLISSFDGAENEVIDYVTEGIDIEDIRSALAESIAAYYEQQKKTTSQRADRKENNIQENGE